MLNCLGFPEVALHIYVAIGLEDNAFRLQQRTLAIPAWGSATCIVHHTMTR